MHPALVQIRELTRGTRYEGDLFLVGGAVRDELLGQPARTDYDLVTTGDAMTLAELLAPISSIPPVTYPRFGTAMLRIQGAEIELVRARKESYDSESRKPLVEPATLVEDALRRDFTVNTLLRNLHSGEMLDPTGQGLADLNARVLRTPLDPKVTFIDDPLRMLRAIRFRWRLGFELDPAAVRAIHANAGRLEIVSFERIRDEIFKILAHESAPAAFAELMSVGIMDVIGPEFVPMVGCEQGKYHHLDVWSHTLLVLKNIGTGSRIERLAALFHDVGKPPTRTVDEQGNTRFFGHEAVGAQMTQQILTRWKLPQREIDQVALLVKNHMRLGSAPVFTPSAARRLMRDLGEQLEPLLRLVEADAGALKAGVRVLDLAEIRAQLEQISAISPIETLESPLTGAEIMQITGLPPGRAIGELKNRLAHLVIEGQLAPGDKAAARRLIEELL